MTAWTFGHCRELDGHHPTFGSMLHWTDIHQHSVPSYNGRTPSDTGLRPTLGGHFPITTYNNEGPHRTLYRRLHTGWISCLRFHATLDGHHPTLDFVPHWVDISPQWPACYRRRWTSVYTLLRRTSSGRTSSFRGLRCTLVRTSRLCSSCATVYGRLDRGFHYATLCDI